MYMQPNEEQQYAIDYLDSIATVPRSTDKGVSDKLFFGLIAGGLLLALVVGLLFAFLNTGNTTPKQDLARLSAKLQSLQTITDTTQKNIVSNNLRGINSTLSLTLTNTAGDLAPLLASNGVDSKKIDAKIVAAENTDEILKELDDAWLNAVIDRSYAREMSYQLETLILLLNQIDSKTNSASLKEFLADTKEKMEPLRDRFAQFNAATS